MRRRRQIRIVTKTSRAHRNRTDALAYLVLSLLPADVPAPPTGAAAVRTVWLADLQPDRVRSGTSGRFVFVPDSRPDEVDGRVVVEATGPTLLASRRF